MNPYEAHRSNAITSINAGRDLLLNEIRFVKLMDVQRSKIPYDPINHHLGLLNQGRGFIGVGLLTQNFEVLKNREDSSDFDDFWTKTSATTRSFFSKLFTSSKKNSRHPKQNYTFIVVDVIVVAEVLLRCSGTNLKGF